MTRVRSSTHEDMDVRPRIEAWEAERLSPFAAKAADSAGREKEEAHDPVRTVFQRDRDRILHSRAFRRLKHKTQVFIDPEGDHYRTRLTHTLEVAQIARTIGRALQLNEDLIEAIALGHDVGHSPFGHAGERALDEAIQEYRSANPDGGMEVEGFQHWEQSLRIVRIIEPLNLSQEVLAGISGHSKGPKDLTDADGVPTSTLEAAVVRVSDRIAYLNHDLDDAIRAGVIDGVPQPFEILGVRYSERVGITVQDVIEQSTGRPEIRISPHLREAMNGLKDWMFENVYLRYPTIYPDIAKAENMVKELLHHFLAGGSLPEGYSGVRGAVDYVAGMTDRFAIATYRDLKLPSVWRREV